MMIMIIIITPVLGIIFNVFYQVHCEGDVCSIAHFSFTFLYPLPDDRMIERSNDPCHRK